MADHDGLDLHTLRPEPGDVLILHSATPLTADQAERMMATLRSTFPGHAVLVIDSTCRLAAMSRDDMREVLADLGLVSITRRETTRAGDRLTLPINGSSTLH